MCKYYVAALLLMGSMPTMAQSDDFGLWSEVNLEKKLSKKWSLDAGLEYRNRDNMKTADRWSFGANANYKLTDWLKLSAGYSLLNDHYYKLNDSGKKYADYWGLRHRFNVSATASQPVVWQPYPVATRALAVHLHPRNHRATLLHQRWHRGRRAHLQRQRQERVA